MTTYTDTQRLDFILRECAVLHTNPQTGEVKLVAEIDHGTYKELSGDGKWFVFPRDAIDAAMPDISVHWDPDYMLRGAWCAVLDDYDGAEDAGFSLWATATRNRKRLTTFWSALKRTYAAEFARHGQDMGSRY